MRARSACRKDRGAVLPIVAGSMVALLMVAAFVLDLGATRGFRQNARLAADAGATAGAYSVTDTTGAACRDAIAYTFQAIAGTQPSSSSISTACTPLAAVCSGTTARVATLTVGSTTVTVVNPVPDGSPLLAGTSLGSSVSQSINTSTDGTACERVAVTVTQPQSSFFGGLFSSGTPTFTVHSVARYSPEERKGPVPPALVALNQSACNAIDAGNNGTIYLVANSRGPGIAYSDSNSTSCSGTSAILASRSSGRMFAEASGAITGELAWYQAPAANGYNNSASTYQLAPTSFGGNTQNYVGRLYARTSRVTREPADSVYHCTNVSPTPSGCTSATDAISTLQTLAASGASSAPSGYSTIASCAPAAPVTLSGNVWVNCPDYLVKGTTVTISAGSSVIFKGSLSVQAGGTLRANTSGSIDSNGYPLALDTTKQTQLLVNSTAATAISITSNSSAVQLAQTTVFSQGGLFIQPSQEIRWTPPTAGLTQSLIYWSESTQPFNIQGSPVLKAKGVFFQGNGALTAGGGGTIDLTHVQMWMDTASVAGGSTTLKLAADPETAITTSGAGTALIR